MHRSGTSAITRGLAALGVYLGNDFLDAQPENPTGYWEDRGLVDLNERLLKALGLTWDSDAPIRPGSLESWRLWRLRRAAIAYVKRAFASHPLWGFKDPRTIRVLPFWLSVLRACNVDDRYLLAIRNPRSVAASLFARQAMDETAAYRLWLAHTQPFSHLLASKPLVVVDYDLFVQEPRAQLARISHALSLAPLDGARAHEVDRFVEEFLDEGLRHSRFTAEDIGAATPEARAAREAYLALHARASEGRSATEPKGA
jgi:hypothetical protein